MSTAELPEHKEVYMPKLSPTMAAGSIAEWVKNEGDHIEAGDVIAEIETDKTSRSYEWNDEGYLAKILIKEHEPDVPVGKIMCIIVEEEGDVAAFKDYVPPDDTAPSAVPETPKDEGKTDEEKTKVREAPEEPSQLEKASSQGKQDGRILASPFARVKAEEAGISLRDISATGPGGRIVVADVEGALSEGAGSTKEMREYQGDPAGAELARLAYTDVPLNKLKRVTAERLVQSKQTVPHYYVNGECNIDEMLRLRSIINAKAKAGEYKLSINDFVVKATAAALRKIPEVNAQWMGDKIRMFHQVDISIAVQTPSGLITPIVKDADRKGLKEISQEVKLLAAKAKDNDLTPEEYMGGTFTISNLGMYGTDEFVAIVNPPQAAILAIGAAKKQVIPDDKSDSGIRISSIMNVTLSCDHRVIDGAIGAQWLREFKNCIQDPVQIIV